MGKTITIKENNIPVEKMLFNILLYNANGLQKMVKNECTNICERIWWLFHAHIYFYRNYNLQKLS